MPAIVIFDTNAYRNLVHGLGIEETQQVIRDLRAREERAGIRAAASSYVMLELLAHLADPADTAYRICLSAVCALQLHCEVDQGTGQVAVLGDVESHLARGLYGADLPDHAHVTEVVAWMCLSVQTHPTDEHLAHIRTYLKEIQAWVVKSEDDFVSDMQNFVVRSVKPDADDWRPFQNDPAFRRAMLEYLRTDDALKGLAEAFAFKAMVQANKAVISDPQFEDKVAFLAAKFSAPLRLYRAILLRIITTGCDLTKNSRSNWLWDIQISFTAGQTVGGAPLQLVTGDKDIAAAAHEAGAGDAVLSLDEYLSRIST